MMRLVELVNALVDESARVRAADPRCVVRWYNADGTVDEREIEIVFADNAGGRLVFHVPRPAQLAGEPGAGDVVDESVVPELDVELVLGFATGERGCNCADGRCATPRHPECRERLKLEQQNRIREGGRRRDA
jgi:hypothetical protein